MFSMRRAAIACLVLLALLFQPAWAKKPKAAAEPVSLPGDLNLLSLRMDALDMLYQMDLSPEQIVA